MTEQLPFRVLTVCTGNICRSPVAERLLAGGLGQSVQVSSAGTAALIGEPVDVPMAALAADAGVEVTAFAAQQVNERLLRAADLVLAMTRDHRAQLVSLAPATVRRSYTLREFARIIGRIDLSGVPIAMSPGERLRAITPLAASMRPLVRPAADETDDVPDPYGREPAVYEQAMGMIREATASIIRVARG